MVALPAVQSHLNRPSLAAFARSSFWAFHDPTVADGAFSSEVRVKRSLECES